jgi:nitrate/nitrite transport system permease protein
MTSNASLRTPATSPGADLLKKWGPFIVPPVVCIGTTFLIWQFLCMSDSSKMPGPVRVIAQTTELILNPFQEDGIGVQLLTSLQRVALGYVLAAVVGVAIGILLGVNTFLRRGFDPLVQVLRTIPPLAWLPISLAIFQDGSPAALFLIFITAIWPIVINTAVGVQQIPKDYNNVAKVLCLSGREYLFNILIPSTVPYIFTGLRIGIGLAWLAIVAAEMLASGAGGIGFYIWDAYNAGNDNSMSQIVLAVFCVGIIGLVLDRLVGYVGSLIVAEE